MGAISGSSPQCDWARGQRGPGPGSRGRWYESCETLSLNPGIYIL
jgi:hypothetical protein